MKIDLQNIQEPLSLSGSFYVELLWKEKVLSNLERGGLKKHKLLLTNAIVMV